MSDKPFYDNGRADKNLKLVVRAVGMIIFGIVVYLTFIHNPHVNADKFSNETMWEAVHPFKWYKIFGIAGMVFYFLYVLGFAGKVIYAFSEPKTDNSPGLLNVIFAVSVALMITMYL